MRKTLKSVSETDLETQEARNNVSRYIASRPISRNPIVSRIRSLQNRYFSCIRWFASGVLCFLRFSLVAWFLTSMMHHSYLRFSLFQRETSIALGAW